MKRFFVNRPVLRAALEMTCLVIALFTLFDAFVMTAVPASVLAVKSAVSPVTPAAAAAATAAAPPEFGNLLQAGTLTRLALFATIGLLAIYLYLKRVMGDFLRLPGKASATAANAVPAGVKNALDTLSSGVLLLSPRGEILLANKAFRAMNPEADQRLEGKTVHQLDWFVCHVDKPGDEYPWVTVIRTNQAMLRRTVLIRQASGKSQELIMNCSSINDEHGISRGCIISFDDVTLLANARAAIVQAMSNLKSSSEQIQRQNSELQRHANLDAMTGCLNRRAFFSIAEPLFKKLKQTGGVLYCIMVDIDHFKLVNDRHGHSVGDLVIQQVASTIHRSLRGKDLFCRYGGEEFCLLLDGGDPDGLAVAERLRERIEKEGGPGVRTVANLRVTSSFGVSALGLGGAVESLKQLIDLADAALYESKRKGRNQVSYAKDGSQIADGTHSFGL
ncbi:MAG: diguanylate cyclase [Janthinobacterium lividum]